MAKVKLNNAGFRALRTDPKVVADLKRRADRVAAASGGEVGDAQTPRNRARFAVFKTGGDGNDLLRGLQAGRG